PDVDAIAKLYSLGFYQQIRQHLSPAGVFVTQASSPFFAPKAFACIATTLAAAAFKTYPYTVSVPSFGPWGFVLASQVELAPARLALPVAPRFLTPQLLPTLFVLPGDIHVDAVQVNRLSNPVIVRYQNDPRWTLYD
ncbi:MAG TPA: hypothetical protein VEZ50_16310, partial [Nodosilinea sp.]|nr:hypothetical protein [Nodosilinea sp.]